MVDSKLILDAIYAAVDEVNLLLPPDRRLQKAENTQVVGDGAALDSLGFLNFILLAETKINESGAARVNLAERLLADAEPPASLGELARLVSSWQEG